MLVDFGRLAALRDEIGEDGFDEVLDIFIRESDEVVHRLCGSRAGGTMEADLHFLKGNALTLGMDALAEMCRRGEQGAEVAPAELVALYQTSCAALRAGPQIRNSAKTSSLVMSR